MKISFRRCDVSRFPRVAFVQDALPFYGGAERLLEAALGVFPGAPIFTLVYNPEAFSGTLIGKGKVIPSFIDRLPASHRRHRYYIPLYPLAIEQFDLGAYDVIISFSYAVAHGVLPGPDQLHLSFLYTPLRYAWHYYHQFLQASGLRSGLKGWPAKILLHYLRLWDLAASRRVDQFVAISQWVSSCIWRAYRRPSRVIYPPVDVDRFLPTWPRSETYVTISRLEQHKNVSVIVEAFSMLGLPLVIIGDGSQAKVLRAKAAPNITFLGKQPDRVVEEILGKAKCLVHAAEEDFGIAMVEAQAAGCPVISYARGGALETVIEGETGLFFNELTLESLVAVVESFEKRNGSFDTNAIIKNASRFGKDRFQNDLATLVASEWSWFYDRGRESSRGSSSQGMENPNLAWSFTPHQPVDR
jgi:glycosyltransferase involved in cell wall biosynthesis